ncbi:hypothetical protein ACFLX2_00330 [Candidatus Dependentiae bacterium]
MTLLKNRLFSIFSMICLLITPLARADMVSQLVSYIQQQGNLNLLDLPGLNQLPIPTQISDLLASLSVDDPTFSKVGNGFKIDVDLAAYGIDLATQINVQHSLQGLDVSVLLSFPQDWKLSSLMPTLHKLDVFSCRDMKLVIANYEYDDPELGVSIGKGANLFGTLVLDGLLNYVTYLLGENLDEIQISGLIVPGVIGSSFSARLPGRIDFMGGFSAQEIDLSIAIDGQPSLLGLPSCSLTGSVVVDWAGQDPLWFSSAIDLYVEKARLSGSMEGMINNIFGIYGLHAGNWHVGGVIDYAVLGFWHVPISEFLMSFELGIGNRKVAMASKMGLSATGVADLAFEGTLEGDFSFSDCLDLTGNVIDETPTIEETGDDFKNRVEGSIPSFVLGDVRLFFSPKDIELNGIDYSRGLIIDGRAHLFGSEAQVSVDIQSSGMKVIGYLEEMEYGPVKITGPGYDRIMNTPDDGLILDAELTLEKQYCFIGAAIEIDVLGGISAETTIDVSAAGIEFYMERKIFNLFDCALLFDAKLNDRCIPVDFYVKGHMRQSALSALQEILSKTARMIAKNKMREFKQRKASFSDIVSGAYNGFWNLLAGLVGNTFNIKEFSFEASLDELVGKTQLPSVTIKGTVLGKDFELNDLSFDLDDVIGSVTDIVNMLSGLFD